MDINPAINHDADTNVLGDTEINVDVLHRFCHKQIEHIIKYPLLLSL